MYNTSLHQAKLNDEVWHKQLGFGTIVYTQYDDNWIQVSFNGILKWFTKNGEEQEHSNLQVLF